MALETIENSNQLNNAEQDAIKTIASHPEMLKYRNLDPEIKQIIDTMDKQTGALDLSSKNIDNTTLENIIQYIVSKQIVVKTLNLGDNQLTSLPQSIGNLANLEILYLSDNQLTSLPSSIGNLANLEILYLSDNQLTSLPQSIGNLTNLDALLLDNNKLISLPESIGNLANLEILYLSDNQLTSLPQSIGKLTNLTELNLSNNKLTSLPQSIGKLANLRALHLSNNKLTSLPQSIGKLTNLTELNLSNNKLTSLPQSIVNLTQLKALGLDKNQLSSLGTDILTDISANNPILYKNILLQICRTINNEHDLEDTKRFAILDKFDMHQLYDLIIYGKEEIFTSSFQGIYHRLNQKLTDCDTTYDVLFRQINYKGLTTFMNMIASYGQIDSWMNMLGSNNTTIFEKIIDNISNNNMSDLVAFVEIIYSINDTALLQKCIDMLDEQYITNLLKT